MEVYAMKMSQPLKKALTLLTTALLISAYVTPVLATTKDSIVSESETTEGESTIATEIEEMSESSELVISVTSEEPTTPSIPELIETVAPEPSTTESLEDTTEVSATSDTDSSDTSTSDTTASSETTSESTASSSSESELTSDTSSEDSSSEVSESTQTTDSSQSSTESSTSESLEQSTDTTVDSSSNVPSDSSELSTDSSSEVIKDSQELPRETPNDHAIHTLPQGPFPSVGTILDAQLESQNFIESNLNGFELPLLHSYQNKQDAAVVYAALNHLNAPYADNGQGPDTFNNINFPRYLYQEVFGVNLAETFDGLVQFGAKAEVSKVRPGDVLVWEKEQRVAIYLGQNKFIMADDTLASEQVENQSSVPKTDAKETEEVIPGVRIFTLHLDDLTDDSADEKDLLTRYDFIRTPDYSVNRPSNWDLSAYGQQQLDLYPVTFDFQVNSQTTAFIESIGEAARDLGLKYDVFASVLIAQGILESGSGSSGLSRAPYYNVFGIKGSSGGASVSFPTMEDNGKGELYGITSAFRAYPSYQESLADYVSLLRSGISGNQNFYRKAWRSEAQNYLRATRELTGKYATDTHYNNKLNSIIAAYNLTRFDKPRVSLSNEMMNFNQIPQVYRDKIRFPEFNGQNYNTSGSYGSDQCTWYVYNRVTQLGGKVGDFMGNGADWRNTGDREGYVTSDVPKVGYMISFKQGVAGYHPLYGHVAFVEAVSDEGILISEGDASYINYRVIPNEIALSSGVGYVAPK